MIRYDRFCDLICTFHGSVLIRSAAWAILLATPSGILKYLDDHPSLSAIYLHNTVDATSYKAFSALLGFFLIYRLSQAYGSYWRGVHDLKQLSLNLFATGSMLVGCLNTAKADSQRRNQFQHILIRLLSILHALALLELEGTEHDPHNLHERFDTLQTIDAASLDDVTLRGLRESPHKIEMVVLVIHSVIAENLSAGVFVHQSAVTKALQKLYDGLSNHADCLVVANIQFPFPYAQATAYLLIVQCLITPIMICVVTRHALTAFFYCFLLLVTYLILYLLAMELEHPFGDTSNSFDVDNAQEAFNSRLLLLVSPIACHAASLKPESAEDLFERALNDTNSLRAAMSEAEARPPKASTRVLKRETYKENEPFTPSGRSSLQMFPYSHVPPWMPLSTQFLSSQNNGYSRLPRLDRDLQ